MLAGKYGHGLHFWDLKTRSHVQALDLGAEQQMVLEVRPAHDPAHAYGFVGVVVSLEDLSASIFLWRKGEGNGDGPWSIKKVVTIPAQPADADDLPELLKGFGAVPPLVTDIDLSVDDKFLYVSCWGIGEFHQYDVTDPDNPKLVGNVKLGGIINRTPHPAKPDQPLNGGPQMVEVSRDGKRVYFTNSLYSPWDEQFYPDGVQGWMVKLDADPNGGMEIDPKFLIETGGMRVHQVRLEGGDASSDSYCFRLAGRGGLGDAIRAGRVSRHQPGYGLAVRRRSGNAGAPSRDGVAGTSAACPLAMPSRVAAALMVAVAVGALLPIAALRLIVAALLIGFGAYKLTRSRHPRYGGMQMSRWNLVVWSFLMASAHGAGLMVAPLLLGTGGRSAMDMPVTGGRCRRTHGDVRTHGGLSAGYWCGGGDRL